MLGFDYHEVPITERIMFPHLSYHIIYLICPCKDAENYGLFLRFLYAVMGQEEYGKFQLKDDKIKGD